MTAPTTRGHDGWRVLTALSYVTLIPAAVTSADIGPKPTFEMRLAFSGAPIPVLGMQLLHCQDSTCAVADTVRGGVSEVIRGLSGTGVACWGEICRGRGFGYAPILKVVITFADRDRESHVFTKRAFDAVYTVTVTETGLVVEEETVAEFARAVGPDRVGDVVVALAGTVLVEMIVAGLYVVVFRRTGRLLRWVPVVNVITVPVVWFLARFPLLPGSAGLTLLLAEGAAVLFEAEVLLRANRTSLSRGHAAALSMAMNTASFLTGATSLWALT